MCEVILMHSTAFIFPGQGSQSVGMLANLAQQYPELLQTFEEASDRLSYDIWALVQNGPESVLNQTEYTQVAMLTADISLFRLFSSRFEMKPTIMAGHSLGEYAALVCAQSLTLSDGVWLVSERGKLMQATIPLGVGAMAAIVGLANSVVESLCVNASGADCVVTPANYNCEGQVVIAGHTRAVEKALLLAQAEGARLAKLIPVSVPCHCPLLKPTAIKFNAVLNEAKFQVPTLPVISNVDLSNYNTPEEIKNLLSAQLFSPVRWLETIRLMKTEGVQTMVECGPGKVLAGLVKRIEPTVKTINACEALEKE